jgi:subtilase family protein
VRRLICVAAIAAGCGVLWLPAAAPAAGFAAPRYAVSPMTLPATGAHAAAAEPKKWLVGARNAIRVDKVAGRFGAKQLNLHGTYVVPRARARGFAAALRRRGALAYAEPDVTLERASVLDIAPAGWARGAVVPPTAPPPVPRVTVGVVDDFVDTTLPDLAAQTRVINGPPAITGSHGTEVASTISGAFNGTGVTGIFPSVPLVNFGLPQALTCSAAANGIVAVVRAKATVVNLSFGSSEQCATLFRVVEAVYGTGVLLVAAAGNEGGEGNAPQYPAAWPHVLSVAALNEALAPASFSNRNAAVDVAAPGVNVPVDTPLPFDTDGTPDAARLDSGTSFASPIVAGTAAWVWSARPTLGNGQVADVLRESARDVSTPGYDTQTGFGLVNLPNALTARTPLRDPLEPNDDIAFVDGTAFRSPDRYLYRGVTRAPIRASVDEIEDPIDVYRIRVPARRSVLVRLRTTFGDADLFAFAGNRKTLQGTPVARSVKKGKRTDSFTLRNPSGVARRFYIAIDSASDTSLNSAYTLSFQRR